MQPFLQACLSTHNSADPKPYIPHERLIAPPPLEAQRWTISKFKKCFPTLQPQQQPSQSTAAGPDLQAIMQPLIQAQIQQLQLFQSASTNNLSQQEEKKEVEPPSLGISDQEISALLQMCGELSTASPSLLPQWVHLCAQKNTSDEYKYTIIRKHIMDNVVFNDADVPLTTPLLKMIVKRKWLGKDGDTRLPSILNAMEGLSPFPMADIDADDVARINSAATALAEASHTTVDDINKLKAKQQPSVPDSPNDFLQLLKRFGNLLAAIFSQKCPLFKCIHLVITALKQYS